VWAGVLLVAAAVMMMVKDLFNQMVQAKVKEELTRRAEEAARAATLQPALEQVA
jgi:hypothetical protein